jgi:hypothetical protein
MDPSSPELDPIPTLRSRVAAELAYAFAPSRPVRCSRAAAGSGGAVAVASQARDDREAQVFSFDRLDEHQPFTLRISLDALAKHSAETLRRGFELPGRGWAEPIVGALYSLHAAGLVDLSDSAVPGINLAILSDGLAGTDLHAAVGVAARENLVDHFALRGTTGASTDSVDSTKTRAKG